MRVIMFLLHILMLRRDYIIFNLCNILFDADQNAQFSLLTYLRLMQFSYTKIGNFPDDFMFLNEWLHFYTEISKFPEDFMSLTRHTIFIKWIFCIFCVLYKNKKQQQQKHKVPIHTACIPWSKTTKIGKNRLMQKNSVMAMIRTLVLSCWIFYHRSFRSVKISFRRLVPFSH